MISGWPSAAGRPVILPGLNIEHLWDVSLPQDSSRLWSHVDAIFITQRKILKLLQVHISKKKTWQWLGFLFGSSFFCVIFPWKEEIEFKIRNWETLFMSGDSVIPEALGSMVGRSRQTNQIWSCAFHRPLLPQFPAEKCLRFTSNLS